MRRKIFRRNPQRLEYSPDDKEFWVINQDYTMSQIKNDEDDEYSWDILLNQDQLSAKLVELPSGMMKGLDVYVILRQTVPASRITVEDYLYNYQKITGDGAKSSWLYQAITGQIKDQGIWF
jgi:hypothetical protein